jgi:hypothetical protein
MAGIINARHSAWLADPCANAHGLGRRPQFDDRNRKYLLAMHPAKIQEAKSVDIKFWLQPFVRDQEQTPQCVAYATNGYIEAGPVRNNPFKSIDSFYREVNANDAWAPEPHDGTSVLASMQVLQKHGLIGSYQWGYDAETIIDFIAVQGPMVFGFTWYNSMFECENTDELVFDDRSGIAGGHSFLGNGIYRSKKLKSGKVGAVRCVQSWGESWGRRGRFWLAFEDLDTLVHDYGEAAMSPEIQHQGEEPW